MSDLPDFTDVTPRSAQPRPRLRPLMGVPDNIRENRRQGVLVSVLMHGLIILLVLLPTLFREQLAEAFTEGAGGKGPAGGGGGGRGGAIREERVQYFEVRPSTPTPPQPSILPPVVPPEVKPPEVKPPEPTPPTPTPPTETKPAAAPAGTASPTPGDGGGEGRDGSDGRGPGSGGGTGSGQGTGTGTGTGPGTGGGNATIYPPTPTQLILPPQPIPGKVKGTRLVATFDVDERGRVVAFDFQPPTRDNGYNARLREVLAEVRFRPGVRGDGTPVRTNYSFTIELF